MSAPRTQAEKPITLRAQSGSVAFAFIVGFLLNLACHHVLAVPSLFCLAKVLFGQVVVKRIMLVNGDRRVQCGVRLGGRRISDLHPAFEILFPGGLALLIAFVGYERATF